MTAASENGEKVQTSKCLPRVFGYVNGIKWAEKFRKSRKRVSEKPRKNKKACVYSE